MSKIKKSNKQQPLRLGFIGGGSSSTIGQAHYTASHLDGRWQLDSGFFSRQKSINYKTGKNWNVASNRIYNSLSEFISKEAKKLDAVVVQNPMGMGYKGVMSIVKHIKGEKVKSRIDTGVELVTFENMNSKEMQELLNPPIAKYLQEK